MCQENNSCAVQLTRQILKAYTIWTLKYPWSWLFKIGARHFNRIKLILFNNQIITIYGEKLLKREHS